VVPQLGELLRDKLQNPGKGGNQRQAREWLSQCGLDEDTIAYITLKVLLSNIGKNISATAHSGNIEKCLWTEIEVRKLQEQAPSYLWAIVENLKGGEQMHSGAIKQNIFLNAKRRIGITDSETPRYLKIRVGLFLLRLVDSLGIFELRTIKDQGNRKKKKTVVVPTEALIEYLQRGHDEAEVLAPIRLPMVLPPLAWTPETDGHDGGYLTVRSSLVHHVGPNAIYDPGPDGFPPELLEAVNRIQNQEWRINKGILLVLESLQKAQSGLGGLPELPELPEAEWATGTPEENRLAFRRMAEENPDALRDFKEKRRETHHVRLRESGKLIALRMQLKIARMYKDYKRVYFPHFLCSRGRVYPSVLFLNPQGDDRAKALLEFAEGKPLDSVEAVEWWMIHGANAYGYDKVSFGDRVKWVFDHHHEIMECAQNPLENKWWAESSSPFKFLAWCFEYLRRQKDPHGFLTHCPVAMDGTCSGLQHYSALLRDAKGAAAVNLLHSEKPKDIYQDVADIANRKLKELSESDAVIPATGRRPEAPVRRFARVWLGKITRDVAKPGTMTNPYGVTRRGMSEQLRELQEKGKLDIKTDDVWGANSFMADVLYDAVNEVVVSAEVGKE
jgi:DNA-directed RNA polymerase